MHPKLSSFQICEIRSLLKMRTNTGDEMRNVTPTLVVFLHKLRYELFERVHTSSSCQHLKYLVVNQCQIFVNASWILSIAIFFTQCSARNQTHDVKLLKSTCLLLLKVNLFGIKNKRGPDLRRYIYSAPSEVYRTPIRENREAYKISSLEPSAA